MRTPMLAANWKMNKTVAEATDFTTAFLPLVADVADAEIVLAPPFTALAAVAAACRGSDVAAAAQNVHWEPGGAFTGEVSLAMVRDAGASHVIVGHSERRHLFGEDDDAVNRKTRAVLAAGLTPIVCIGETLAEREADETAAVLDRQIDGGLAGLAADDVESIVVAYEPVWAIGTGRTATPEQAQQAHAHVRRRLAALAGGGGRRPLPPAVRRQRQARQRRRPVRAAGRRRGARGRRQPRPAQLRQNRRTRAGKQCEAPPTARVPRTSPVRSASACVSRRGQRAVAAVAPEQRRLKYHWWLC